jgi:hypothetical protein
MGGSATHELLQEKIYDEIKYQLRDHTRAIGDPILSNLLGNIEGRGQMRVKLDAQCEEDVFGTKYPDAQLWAWHEGISTPQFLIEVGYSQKNKDLPSLAREYYEGSNGKIKTVLTVKVPYLPPKERKNNTLISHDENNRPSFSLYRGPGRIHHNQAFRNNDGTPATDISLQLFLSDFIPDPALEKLNARHQAQLQ